MRCYRCQEDMVKSELSGVLTDRCLYCKGIWLDAGELESLLFGKKKNKTELMNELRKERREEKNKVEVIDEICCPKCTARAMTKMDKKGVKVDFCLECGGIYFDEGELKELIKKERGGLIVFLKSLFGL